MGNEAGMYKIIAEIIKAMEIKKRKLKNNVNEIISQITVPETRYRKEDKSGSKNYRRITLTSMMGKY